jgi:hypothetical protein
MFGPGHLGELTQIVPFELADAVLAETRAAQRRLRLLPRGWGSTLCWRSGCSRRPGTGGCGRS